MALSTSAGARDRLITFERATVTRNAMNEPVKSWAAYTRAYASVSFGTGQERREAAQESASVPATFRILRTPKTATLTVEDRIAYLGAAWDITSIVPAAALNEALDVTATRAG